MSIAYAINNYLNDDTYCCESSINTDSDWVLAENLYNALPSYPFRFDDVGGVGNPEWFCWDLGAAKQVTLVSIFNHNVELLSAVGDEWTLKLCSKPCEDSGACNWDAPDYEISIADRRLDDFRNIYRILNQTYRYGRVDIIDQNNADGYVQYGEVFVGLKSVFSRNVHIQPGWVDDPNFYEGQGQTYYGQDWGAYFSEGKTITLSFMNTGDPQVVDEFMVFLRAIKRNNGYFVLIPDTSTKFVYYVICTNLNRFTARPIYNPDCGELRQWDLECRVLTEGTPLL